MDDLYNKNLAKIEELDSNVQWAGNQMLADCWTYGKRFNILSAYRSYRDQLLVYTKGRSIGDIAHDLKIKKITVAQYQELSKIYAAGRNIQDTTIRTWTLDSFHTRRLAIDIQPINCTHLDIIKIALRYDITHPIPQDPPHYQFDRVRPRPLYLSMAAFLDRLWKRISRTAEPAKSRLIRRYERLTDSSNSSSKVP